MPLGEKKSVIYKVTHFLRQIEWWKKATLIHFEFSINVMNMKDEIHFLRFMSTPNSGSSKASFSNVWSQLFQIHNWNCQDKCWNSPYTKLECVSSEKIIHRLKNPSVFPIQSLGASPLVIGLETLGFFNLWIIFSLDPSNLAWVCTLYLLRDWNKIVSFQDRKQVSRASLTRTHPFWSDTRRDRF